MPAQSSTFRNYLLPASLSLISVVIGVYVNLATSDEPEWWVNFVLGVLVLTGIWAGFVQFKRDEKEKAQTAAEFRKMASQMDDFHRSIPLFENFTLLSKDRIEVSHLPDLQPHFIGRKPELALLDAAWENPETNLVQFIAPGGTGKTMLVTYWLEHHLPKSKADRPAAIYAWSFYSQGTDEGRQASSDLFFDRAAQFFQIQLPTDPRERGRTLAERLRRERCLLILDGIEPLQYPLGGQAGLGGKLKDPALAALLRELAFEQPGLCLLTTRVAVENLAGIEPPKHLPRPLENFDKTEGASFLQKLGVRGSQTALETASEEYHGHALALRLLGNYLVEMLEGDVRQRDRIPHLTDDEKSGSHARRVMEAYAVWFESQVDKNLSFWQKMMGEKPPVSPETALLNLMGLFDRPAPVEALDILLKKPAIAGLTDGLANLPAERVTKAFNHLKKLGLLEENRLRAGQLPKKLAHFPALRELESLDAHPLVREHFGQKMEKENPSAWREANTRLYHFHKNLPEKHLPDTLEEMEPLFLAMAFGCRAGLQQEVQREVYWERIRRKEEAFSVKKLGAFGSDLAALANLFEQVWAQPSKNMSDADQAVVLSWAGFGLRGLGRLWEAAEPMLASLKMSEKQDDWKGVAVDASNLSELHLTLGSVQQAVHFGQQAVEFADRSGDGYYKESFRTTLADALNQSGQLEAAATWFAEAEAMQQERHPEYRFLYSWWGFRYCDLLLVFEKWEEVLQRAQESLKISTKGNWLLDIALDQLSIARAHATAAQTGPTDTHCEAAENFLNLAVEGLRKAGTTHHLPKGLLARANWRIQRNRPKEATQDLAEVLETAESGSMGLYLVDYHIAMARLRRLEGLDSEAETHKAEALRRIAETGYLRRQAEAEGL